MGLLDDAIREHLELKRKHGAGDEELQRQETEALGPARRDFNADAAQTTDEPAAPEAEDPGTVAPEPVAEPAGWLDDEPGEPPFEQAAGRSPRCPSRRPRRSRCRLPTRPRRPRPKLLRRAARATLRRRDLTR